MVLGRALVFFTARTLARLPKQSVVAGGELLAGMAGAAITMDVSLLADVVAGRHWRMVGRLKSRRGRGERVQAIIHREFLPGAALAAAVDRGRRAARRSVRRRRTGYDVLVPIAAGFAGFAATRPLMDGLRSVCRSTGLVRALGMDLKDLRVAMAVVPGGFVLLWTLAASRRWERADDVRGRGGDPDRRGTTGVRATTVVRRPAGRVADGRDPAGLFSQPIRGFDLLLLCLLPVLFGWPPLWCYVIPGIVLAIMFSVRPKTA